MESNYNEEMTKKDKYCPAGKIKCDRLHWYDDPYPERYCFTCWEWYKITTIPVKGMEQCPWPLRQEPLKNENQSKTQI